MSYISFFASSWHACNQHVYRHRRILNAKSRTREIGEFELWTLKGRPSAFRVRTLSEATLSRPSIKTLTGPPENVHPRGRQRRPPPRAAGAHLVAAQGAVRQREHRRGALQLHRAGGAADGAQARAVQLSLAPGALCSWTPVRDWQSCRQGLCCVQLHIISVNLGKKPIFVCCLLGTYLDSV